MLACLESIYRCVSQHASQLTSVTIQACMQQTSSHAPTGLHMCVCILVWCVCVYTCVYVCVCVTSRSEYLAIGQDAVAALQAANAVPVPPGYLAPPPDTTPRLKRRPSPRRGRDDAPALTPQPRRRRSRVTTEDTAGAAAGPRGPSAAPQMDVAAVAEAVSEVAEAAAAGAAAAMVAAAEAAVEAAASAAESALQPPRESEEEMLIATANRLDTEFSMLLAQLGTLHSLYGTHTHITHTRSAQRRLSR